MGERFRLPAPTPTPTVSLSHSDLFQPRRQETHQRQEADKAETPPPPQDSNTSLEGLKALKGVGEGGGSFLGLKIMQAQPNPRTPLACPCCQPSTLAAFRLCRCHSLKGRAQECPLNSGQSQPSSTRSWSTQDGAESVPSEIQSCLYPLPIAEPPSAPETGGGKADICIEG